MNENITSKAKEKATEEARADRILYKAVKKRVIGPMIKRLSKDGNPPDIEFNESSSWTDTIGKLYQLIAYKER